MTTLDDFIRQTIETYRVRANMSAREFGVLALGDPGFVSSLESGRSMRLDTADRVRSWMHGTKRTSGSGTPDEGRPRERGVSAQGDAPTFLSTRRAAALLTLSPRTLDRFREIGTGPPFFRFGQRIVYSREDLLDWAWSKRENPES